MTSKSMRTQLVVLAAGMLLAGHAWAERFMAPKNYGIEASSDGLVLPSGNTGRVLYKSCLTCSHNSLEIGSDTEFFVGADEVDYATLKRFVSSGGPYFVMLYHEPGRTVYTRIVVAARLHQ